GSLTKDTLYPIFAAPRANASALRVVSRIFSGFTSSVSANPQPDSLYRTLIPAPRSFNSSLAGFSLITLTASETVFTSLKSAYVAFSRAAVSRQTVDSSSPRPSVGFTSPISARLALELSNRPVLHSPFPSVQPSNDQHAGRCHGYSGYEVNDVVLTQIDGWEEYSYHYRNAHKGICSLQFD